MQPLFTTYEGLKMTRPDVEHSPDSFVLQIGVEIKVNEEDLTEPHAPVSLVDQMLDVGLPMRPEERQLVFPNEKRSFGIEGSQGVLGLKEIFGHVQPCHMEVFRWIY